MKLVRDKDYFVITTNVDHYFQKAGFDKKRLFYTQGDYGLFQCSVPCCQETFENEAMIREMVKRQKDMKVPTELLPVCPHCGKPLTMNLRNDDKFMEDEGWHRAAERYENFLRTRSGQKILFLELGAGYNTPVIIKRPLKKAVLPRAYRVIELLPFAFFENISFPPRLSPCPREYIYKKRAVCPIFPGTDGA